MEAESPFLLCRQRHRLFFGGQLTGEERDCLFFLRILLRGRLLCSRLLGLLFGLLLRRLWLRLLLLLYLRRRGLRVVIVIATADQSQPRRTDAGAGRSAHQRAAAEPLTLHPFPVISLCHLSLLAS